MRARIVVLNWNGARYLQRCLAALTAEAGDRAELVLVDNASSDESIAIVRDHFPQVRIVALDRNAGYAAGNNAGARDATTDYLVFLNNDTEVAPGWLTALLNAADAHESRAVIGSNVVFMQGAADGPILTDSAGDDYFRAGGATKAWHRQPAATAPPSREVFTACGAAMLVPRALFEALGGFDERLFLIYEDVDLCYRARLRGHRVRYAADALVRHAGSASLGRLSQTSVFYGQRNLEWVWLQDTPAPLLWRSLLPHLAYSLAGGAFYARRGHAVTWLRAKAAALAGIPATLRRRREIQSTITVDPADLWSLMRPSWLSAKRSEKF